jgi:hypothetical protein
MLARGLPRLVPQEFLAKAANLKARSPKTHWWAVVNKASATEPGMNPPLQTMPMRKYGFASITLTPRRAFRIQCVFIIDGCGASKR